MSELQISDLDERVGLLSTGEIWDHQQRVNICRLIVSNPISVSALPILYPSLPFLPHAFTASNRLCN
jgi:hypothetical protein